MKKLITFSRDVVLFGILLISFNIKSYAQKTVSRIDSLLNSKYKKDAPGAVFLAAQNGEIIYEKSFGLSNLELAIPMNTNNVFEIGSMTKQFTAISILILSEKGKLSLSDNINKYIPDFPLGDQISIHHLLTHTSGLKDFTRLKELNEMAKNELEPLEVIALFKNDSLEFNPGELYKYSNSGYFLLGYIIEQVSGLTYEEFVKQNIFIPLAMNATRYNSAREIIPNRAYGYQLKDDYVNKTYISYSIPYSTGALISSAKDMLNWQNALLKNKLLDAQTTRKAFTNYTLNNGQKIDYGYGWHIKNTEGTLSFEHGGSIFGFKSMGVYLPEKDIYVIGLTNCDCNSPTQITREIAQIISEIL